MTLEVLHSLNPRQLIQDNFPEHEPHVRSSMAELLPSAGPIKVRCACKKVLKVSLQRDIYSTDRRRAMREMIRKVNTPEGQGVVGFVRALYQLLPKDVPVQEETPVEVAT